MPSRQNIKSLIWQIRGYFLSVSVVKIRQFWIKNLSKTMWISCNEATVVPFRKTSLILLTPFLSLWFTIVRWEAVRLVVAMIRLEWPSKTCPSKQKASIHTCIHTHKCMRTRGIWKVRKMGWQQRWCDLNSRLSAPSWKTQNSKTCRQTCSRVLLAQDLHRNMPWCKKETWPHLSSY